MIYEIKMKVNTKLNGEQLTEYLEDVIDYKDVNIQNLKILEEKNK